MQRFAIIGSGPSIVALGIPVEFPINVTTIAVNGGVDLTKDPPHYFFTLDLSDANKRRLRLANRRKGTQYYVAEEPFRMRSIPLIFPLARVVGKGNERYRIKEGLCANKKAIHTGNSAWGAFQLACHFCTGPARIGLFGVDGYGGYANPADGTPKELGMMTSLFASALAELEKRKIQVLNGSPESIVTCFPRVQPREALEWLSGE